MLHRQCRLWTWGILVLAQACADSSGFETDVGTSDTLAADATPAETDATTDAWTGSADAWSDAPVAHDAAGLDSAVAPDSSVDPDSSAGMDVGPAPGEETCNGDDDDLDGTVDEGLVMRCGSNVGACSRGRVDCVGGVFPACMPEVSPAAETCNGVDDDCDGTVDNGVPPRSCGTNEGACRVGMRVCTDGSFSGCRGSVGPSAETCNGVDDNCDGRVDNGVAPRTCGTNVGTCRTGTRACSGGSFGACRGSVGPVAERDDGLDNDCNGVVDNGIPCETGQGRRVRVATNAQRTGLRSLTCDRGLHRAAQRHAQDMCRTGVFSHTSADGRVLSDRLRQARATYTLAGENLAQDPTSSFSPEGVVTAWMGSPDHRANILNRRFGRLGVGKATCGSMTYWVQVFGN